MRVNFIFLIFCLTGGALINVAQVWNKSQEDRRDYYHAKLSSVNFDKNRHHGLVKPFQSPEKGVNLITLATYERHFEGEIPGERSHALPVVGPDPRGVSVQGRNVSQKKGVDAGVEGEVHPLRHLVSTPRT